LLTFFRVADLEAGGPARPAGAPALGLPAPPGPTIPRPAGPTAPAPAGGGNGPAPRVAVPEHLAGHAETATALEAAACPQSEDGSSPGKDAKRS
jgi:hypothetical protein